MSDDRSTAKRVNRVKTTPSSEAARDAAFFKERERQRTVNDEKTQRLKALRLQKEAADEAARLLAIQNAPPGPVKAPRKKAAVKA